MKDKMAQLAYEISQKMFWNDNELYLFVLLSSYTIIACFETVCFNEILCSVASYPFVAQETYFLAYMATVIYLLFLFSIGDLRRF